MLNVSIGAQIQTGLDGSLTRTTIENAFRFIYTSSTHVCTQSGFILEDSTNSTTRRNRSPIYVYTRLVRQRHYFGNLWSKVQLLKKLEKSPEVQRLADMISTKNIIWHFQQIATFICRLYGDDTTSDLTVLRNRPLQTLIEACKRLEPEWLPSTNRAAHFHARSSSDSTMDIVGQCRAKSHWLRVGKCRLWTISNYEGFSNSPRLHVTI